MTTDLSATSAGTITLLAFSSDTAVSVELAYAGTGTGLLLPDLGGGLFQWNISLEPVGTELRLPLELYPVTSGRTGLWWPYLDIR